MKKNLLPAIVLFVLPSLLLAQSASSSRRLSLSLGPNVSYLAGQTNLGEQAPRVGFSTRVDGEFRLKNRLWLRVGAGYTLMRYKRKPDSGNLQWPSQNNGGSFDPNLPGEPVDYQYAQDKMLSIPVALRYFWDTKQHFYTDLESGVSVVFQTSGNDQLRPNVGMALGWQTTVGAQTWVFVQPAFRLILNNAFSGSLRRYNLHPYGFGLELGLRKGL
jgi:hypothetical protein